MRFRGVPLNCECGRAPTRIRQVGLNSNHQLVIQWICAGCRRTVFTVKDLSECWRECPTREEEQEHPVTRETGVRRQDSAFLRSIGVKFPDEESRP